VIAGDVLGIAVLSAGKSAEVWHFATVVKLDLAMLPPGNLTHCDLVAGLAWDGVHKREQKSLGGHFPSLDGSISVADKKRQLGFLFERVRGPMAVARMPTVTGSGH